MGNPNQALKSFSGSEESLKPLNILFIYLFIFIYFFILKIS